MSKPISPQEAMKKVAQFLIDNGNLWPIALSPHDGKRLAHAQETGDDDSLYLKFAQSFNVEATLYVRITYKRTRKQDDQTAVTEFEAIVEINWASHTGSPAMAMAQLAFASKVAELGCMLEAYIRTELNDIATTHEI